MRRIEALITAEPQPVRTIAATVYGVAPDQLTAAQAEATRRASHRLRDLDRLSLTHVRVEWCRQRVLAVQARLSDKEREDWRLTVEATQARYRADNPRWQPPPAKPMRFDVPRSGRNVNPPRSRKRREPESADFQGFSKAAQNSQLGSQEDR